MRTKLIFGLALFVMAAFDANAVKDNYYDISLMESATEWTLEDTSRAIASEVFRQHWNAHLAKIRLQNRQKGVVDEVTKWDSENYGETVLKVIPTEIARCFFNITNNMVTYNKFDGRMIECVETNPSQYTAANWNYVFLINFLDRFLSNTLESYYYSKKAQEKLFDDVLRETKKVMQTATTKNGYTYDYSKYAENINKAYDDIKAYSEKLDLVEYLDELRCVRRDAANIKSSIFPDVDNYKKQSVAKLKTFISNLDENFGGVDDNKYLSMICRLEGIHKSKLTPKINGKSAGHAYLMICVDLPYDPKSIFFKQYRRVWQLKKENGVMKCIAGDASINDISSWCNADLDLGFNESARSLESLRGVSVGRIEQDIDALYPTKEEEEGNSAKQTIKWANTSEELLDLLKNSDWQKKIEQCETISIIGYGLEHDIKVARKDCKTSEEKKKIELHLKKIDKEINKVSRAINLIPDNKMIDEICTIVKEWINGGYNISCKKELIENTYKAIIAALDLNGGGYTDKGYMKRWTDKHGVNEDSDISHMMNCFLLEK